MHLHKWVCLIALGLAGILSTARPALGQVNTVNLSGTVLDPQGLAVAGAKVSVKSLTTGATRSVESGGDGHYQIIGLPPGDYELTVEAKGMSKLVMPVLHLALGAAAEFNPQMTLEAGQQIVTVTGEPEVIETHRTDVSQSVTTAQIDNLPINGRNYINFTLLNSQAARDNTPSIGAAPTSGLNFGGQRARSNEVSVDGADAVDNSTNGIRATVSQEAVQEFQLLVSNFMPEYGRAMGGVVNIVTKSGSNDVHGNAFGYLRQSAIQARNPFSVNVVSSPTTGFQAVPVKQPFTRVQAGVTLGGPIQKDKTFYFFSYETTRRQETGFSSIGANNFNFVNTAAPAAIVPFLPPGVPAAGLLTTGQAAFVNNGLVPAPVRAGYFAAGTSSAAVALFGNTPGFPANFFPSSGAPLPASYVGLASIIGNYPVSEGTSLYSLKLEHIWNQRNTSFVRVSVSPSTISGIQVNAQNQNFGQNAGSRTSVQQTRDLAIVGQHTTVIGDSLFNEFRFQFARRGLHYGFANLPGGSSVAVNIAGSAFFGREPFSTEDRIERRFQWTDNLTWTKGSHTLKFGADTNLIQLRSATSQIFTLNYGGVYNFGSLNSGSLNSAFSAFQAPDFSAVQAYGLGIPTVFFQGIGQSNHPFNNKTLGAFVQDSWKANHKLTINYGVRYDIEWVPTFPAGTALNATAEQALGVVEGIPVDSNNFAPRFAIAWDPWGNGKTVVRAGFGLFYDHPALALAFLATAEDGDVSTLLEAAGGTPSAAHIDNPANVGALNASSIFQGILTGPNITGCSTSTPSMCYLPSQQRFNAFQPNSLFNNQSFLTLPIAPGVQGYPLPLLPFTIPVEKNFQYAYAEQANLTIEREIAKDWKLSVGYNYTHGVHLDRARNISVTDPGQLIANDNKAVAIGLVTPGTNPLTVAVPSTPNTLCAGGVPAVNLAGGSIAFATPTGSPLAPGILGLGYMGQNCSGAIVGLIASPAVFNFFRPTGPNPSFSGLVPGGYNTLVALAKAGGFPTGFSGVQVPWSDVNPQESSGNSVYHAFTMSVSKRFSSGFQLFSSWTYSHAIDDSTDLSTLLNPQDNSFPNQERSNSSFDQRHRWITSAVFQSRYHMSDSGFWKKLLADSTVAPIIEVSSGRPYNVLIGSNTNLDFGSATNRPSVLPAGAAVPAGLPPAVKSPFIKNAEFILPTNCINSAGTPFGPFPTVPSPPFGCTGNLGRNAFTRPGFFQFDLRLSRQFSITERLRLEVIADGFNLLNRYNVSDVNPLCDPTSGVCTAGQPTASFDQRQFQFALKLNW
jgi:hypothetical protein